MKAMDRLLHAEHLREQIALLKICDGLTIKACAGRLGIKEKTADYHWQQIKKIIRGSRLI